MARSLFMAEVSVGAVVGAKIGGHIFRAFMRPYYRRYIEGHPDEIKTAA